MLELSEIKADGSVSKFVTAYYKEGYVYIDVDRILGGIYGGKSVKIPYLENAYSGAGGYFRRKLREKI